MPADQNPWSPQRALEQWGKSATVEERFWAKVRVLEADGMLRDKAIAQVAGQDHTFRTPLEPLDSILVIF